MCNNNLYLYKIYKYFSFPCVFIKNFRTRFVEEHWENELEAELQEYEIVKNNDDGQTDNTKTGFDEIYDLK